jgi:hypothetical protein
MDLQLTKFLDTFPSGKKKPIDVLITMRILKFMQVLVGGTKSKLVQKCNS